MSKINVLIADDSGVMRLLISDILKEDPEMNVVGTATNGQDAVTKWRQLKPDVVLMDMHMGEYDGRYAVKNIMRENPTPIVVLSAIGNSDMGPIMEALSLGAFDYLNKPQKNNARIRDLKVELLEKIKLAYKVDRKKLGQGKTNLNHNPHTFVGDMPYHAVVIGSSTGGPTAVEKVLTRLPSNMPLPVLIAQHMPENFVPSFAKRLNSLTPLSVVVGIKDMVVKPGVVIIAPGGKNMIVKRNEIGQVLVDFTDTRFKEFNNPSIDSLFLSAADIYKNNLIGVILTGMGKDGALGMTDINNFGGLTIAQDEKTSVVYGMPKAAVENGSTKNIVPVQDIGGFIVSSIS